MPEHCTIYCKNPSLGEVRRLLDERFSITEGPSGDEPDSTWLVRGHAGNIRFTAKKFRERGDDFSRLIVSTCVFIEGFTKSKAELSKRLTSHIESCEVIFGVVADPTFDADERYHAIVFAVAGALDGLIFNGHEIIDSNGVTLMSSS